MRIGNSLLVAFTICVLGTTGLANLKSEDIVKPEKLPLFGKWMVSGDLNPSNWLGQRYKGKTLREPINVVIIDRFADSDYSARQRLESACVRAGYKSRSGHSSGYMGFIAGHYFQQMPEDRGRAYSNAPFEFNNNHGRIFGAFADKGKYYFIGAFSREVVTPFKKVKHSYGSFNKAREDFAGKMDARTNYKIIGYANMNNKLINYPDLSTGDHDGSAIILNAVE